jgi:CHAT domain-containing protein
VTNTRDILQTPAAASSKTAEIFSYPDFGTAPAEPDAEGTRMPGFPELKDLPGTKTESDSIKKILHTQLWKVSDHLQKDASEKAIKKVSSPQVLHIATHGFFLKDVKDSMGKVYGIESAIAKENPLLRSGVILAGAAAMAKERFVSVEKEDGILTAYEAAGLDLSGTDLVVLSACETGLGEMLNGQGVYGLQRAFFVAGARSLIMSLWKVDDKATQELMVAFYREWLADPKAGKQKALKAAQLTLKAKYSSPYYWGAFVVLGDN